MITQRPHGREHNLVFQALSNYEVFKISRGDCLILESKFYKFGDLVAVRYGRNHYLGLFAALGNRRYLIQPERVFQLPSSAKILGSIALLT